MGSVASMRPAHQAREVSPRTPAHPPPSSASMRPAHQAREVGVNRAPAMLMVSRFNEARASSAGSMNFGEKTSIESVASMRPAHQAREVQEKPSDCSHAKDSFNEARASSAGSMGKKLLDPVATPSFNEARASSAGSTETAPQKSATHAASMRPAHQAREVMPRK